MLKVPKELHKGRDSKHGQVDKNRKKRKSSWNGSEDDGTESMKSLEHTNHTAFPESQDSLLKKKQVSNETVMTGGLTQHITKNYI